MQAKSKGSQLKGIGAERMAVQRLFLGIYLFTDGELLREIEKENLMSRPHVTGSFFGEIPRHSGGCI